MKTTQIKELEELEALAAAAENMQRERKLQKARESFEDFAEMAIKDEVTGKAITLAPLHRAWVGHMRFCLEHELNCLVLAPMGCHTAGQGVLLVDGSTKQVENVVVGDTLVGPDSKPRKVTETHTGEKPTYNITDRGHSYTVTGDHILVLKRTTESVTGGAANRLAGEVIEVTVDEWLTWTTWKKSVYKLFKTAVEWKPSSVAIDPYFMGVMLGDGYFGKMYSFTSPDPELLEAVGDMATAAGIEYRLEPDKRNDVVSVNFRGQVIKQMFTQVGLDRCLSGTKRVPQAYKVNAETVQLQVLAGLLDTDGHLHGRSFDYISKSEQLANDVVFLARSVGLTASVNKCQKRATNSKNPVLRAYYRVYIGGDTSKIPTRVLRKQAADGREALWKKDSLVRGFNIEPTNKTEQYFGFKVTDDGRYLLDDFTVDHNSGKTQLFGIALPVYLIGSNPNIRLKLIGLSDDSAKERLASIRTYIAHDEDVKAIFPGLKPDEKREWTKHRLFVERTTNAKDASIDAKGVTSTGIGGRCDYLLADDLGDYNSVIAQPAKRDAINNTFKIVWLTRIEPTGSAIMIATRWHERDLAGEIINDPEVRDRWGILIQRVSDDFESIEQEVLIADKYAEDYSKAMKGFDIRLDTEG